MRIEPGDRRRNHSGRRHLRPAGGRSIPAFKRIARPRRRRQRAVGLSGQVSLRQDTGRAFIAVKGNGDSRRQRPLQTDRSSPAGVSCHADKILRSGRAIKLTLAGAIAAAIVMWQMQL